MESKFPSQPVPETTVIDMVANPADTVIYEAKPDSGSCCPDWPCWKKVLFIIALPLIIVLFIVFSVCALALMLLGVNIEQNKVDQQVMQ